MFKFGAPVFKNKWTHSTKTILNSIYLLKYEVRF